MTNPETAAYADQLGWIMAQAAHCLTGLTDAQAAWCPPLPAGNSPAAIVTHLIGATHVYALGFGCGRPVDRDRSAEFAPGQVSVAALRDELAHFATEVADAVPTTPAAALGTPFLPAQHLWGAGTPHNITPRDALIESIRHAAIHLGELRLVTDWAKWQSGEVGR